VRNITIENFAVGIDIKEGRSNHLEAVNLQGNNDVHRFCGDAGGIGLRMTNTTDNQLTKSNVSGNENLGVQLFQSSGNLLNGNQMVQNGIPTGSNIELLSSHQNRISGNDLSRGGLYGVSVEESNGNVIIGNKIKDTGPVGGNGIGI